MDPKRLLESTQDAPSPNVLVQNLLGVARTESAPEGARRRARRSVDSVFAPGSTGAQAPAPEAQASEASAPDGAALKGVARSASKPPPPKSLPPKSLPATDPCPGCNPFG